MKPTKLPFLATDQNGSEIYDTESNAVVATIHPQGITDEEAIQTRKQKAEAIVKAVNCWNNPKALRARLIEMGW